MMRCGWEYDPESQSVTSTTCNVVKNIPLPGACLAALSRKDKLSVINFDDPDVEARDREL